MTRHSPEFADASLAAWGAAVRADLSERRAQNPAMLRALAGPPPTPIARRSWFQTPAALAGAGAAVLCVAVALFAWDRNGSDAGSSLVDKHNLAQHGVDEGQLPGVAPTVNEPPGPRAASVTTDDVQRSVPPSETTLEPRAAAERPIDGTVEAPPKRADDPVAPRTRPFRTTPWTVLARRGRYTRALQAARAADLSAILASASPDELVLLGDTARYTGDRALAQRAFKRARTRGPGTTAASRAAYNLGRLAEAAGQLRDSNRWFTHAFEEADPASAVAREALGRRIRVRVQLGQEAAARHDAHRYLRAYPKGLHADIARGLVADAAAGPRP